MCSFFRRAGGPLLAVLVLGGVAPTSGAADFTVELVHEEDGERLQFALDILRETLVNNGHSVSPAADLTILVGLSEDDEIASLGSDSLDLAPQGYALITPERQTLVIAGHDDLGVVYGCASFAESFRRLFDGQRFINVDTGAYPELPWRLMSAPLNLDPDEPLTATTVPWLFDPDLNRTLFTRLLRWRLNGLVLEGDDVLGALTEESYEPFMHMIATAHRYGITVYAGLRVDELDPLDPDLIERLEIYFEEVGTGSLMLWGHSSDSAHWIELMGESVLPAAEIAEYPPPILLQTGVEIAEPLLELAQDSEIPLLALAPYNEGVLASSKEIDPRVVESARVLPTVADIHVAANLGPYRWSPPEFIQECVKTCLRARAQGLNIRPLSPSTFPYSLEKQDPPILAVDHGWMYYGAWSRYGWTPNRPVANERTYWDQQLTNRYGLSRPAGPLRVAIEEAGTMMPTITRMFATGHDERTSFALGTTFEQIAHGSRPLFPEEATVPLATYVYRNHNAREDRGRAVDWAANDVAALSTRVQDSLEEGGRSVSRRTEEFACLARDLEIVRRLGYYWAYRAIAVVHAEAYVYDGLSSHFRSIKAFADNAMNAFADAALLSQDYAPWPTSVWRPFPSEGRGLHPLDVEPRYREEQKILHRNVNTLNRKDISDYYRGAVARKYSLDVDKAMIDVPEHELGPWLLLETALDERVRGAPGSANLTVTASSYGQEKSLIEVPIERCEWTTYLVSLSRFIGRQVRFVIEVDDGGNPDGDLVLLADPRVVEGHLPSRMAPWYLPPDATVDVSLVDTLEKHPIEDDAVRTGKFFDATSSRRAVAIDMRDGRGSRTLEMEALVGLAPAPNSQRRGFALTRSPGRFLCDNPGVTRNTEGWRLSGSRSALSWIGTKEKLERTRGAVNVELAFQASSGDDSEIALVFGSDRALPSVGNGAALELQLRSNRWSLTRHGEGPTEVTDITGVPASESNGYHVRFEASPSHGAAIWITPTGKAASVLPQVRTRKGSLPAGHVFVRHVGEGSVTIEDLSVSFKEERDRVDALTMSHWPSTFEGILTPLLRGARDRMAEHEYRPIFRSDWERVAEGKRKALREALGFNLPRTPLQAESIDEFDTARAIVEKITVASPFGDSIPGLLFKPKKADGDPPIVVIVPDPASGGKTATPVLRLADLLAEQGIATWIHDLPGQGEREQTALRPGARELYLLGLSEHAVATRELERVVDSLMTRKDIDVDRLALLGVGHSGLTASFLASVDSRIAALVLVDTPRSILDELEHSIAHRSFTPWQGTPGLAPSLSLGDCLALHAPKPAILLAKKDGRGWGGTSSEDAIRRLRRFYRLFGEEDRLFAKDVNADGLSENARTACSERLRSLFSVDASDADESPTNVIRDIAQKCRIDAPRDEGLHSAYRERTLSSIGPTGQRSPSDTLQTLHRAIGEPEARNHPLLREEHILDPDGDAIRVRVIKAGPDSTMVTALHPPAPGVTRPKVALSISDLGIDRALTLPDAQSQRDGGRAIFALSLSGQEGLDASTDRLARALTWTGTTLARLWVDQVRLALDYLEEFEGLDSQDPIILGEGSMAFIALFAAFEDDRLAGLSMRETPLRLASLLDVPGVLDRDGPLTERPAPELCLPGWLSLLTVEEILGALSPKPVYIEEPTDGRRRPLETPVDSLENLKTPIEVRQTVEGSQAQNR